MAVPPGYNDNQFVIGPADIYLDVTPPAYGTLLVLDSNGYPPDGRGLGYVQEGLSITVAWERAPEEATPFSVFSASPAQNTYRLWSITQMAMGGRLVQARSMDRLADVLTAGNRSGVLMTFGASRPPHAVESALAVWRVYPTGEEPAPTWAYCMIYAATNRSDFALGLKRDQQAGLDFIYEGEPDFTRPADDRLGQLYMGE
jgi:hypothetical protein